MIFASVGSIMPFDRFVQAVDEWAAENPGQRVFIQSGDGAYEPRHAEWARTVPHADYRRLLEDCELFVAHVGMGSILQALELRKQTLLMPRKASLREHTTDHQLHTAERFRDTAGILIVAEAAELKAAITRLLAQPMQTADGIPALAPAAFTDRIAAYLAAGRATGGGR